MAYGKKEEVYGFQTLYREIGYYISRLEQYERSLKFFDIAIEKTPNDKRALIGRSRARAKACQYEGALEDINKALSFDPEDLRVLADKALNTYLSCEFEEGLVQNTRLVPIRQKPDHFCMGVMHCTNAIENCIGERAGRPLRDHFLIIRKLAWKKNYEAQKPFEPVPKKKKRRKLERPFMKQKMLEAVQPLKRKNKFIDTGGIRDSLHSHKSEKNLVPRFTQPFPFRPLQRYTTNIENFMAERYLDSMYLDKIFLKKLQSEPGAVCPNAKGSEKIKQLAKNGYKTVAYKQELLRTRRPFYYIKYQEATSSGALKERQEKELIIQQATIKKQADILLFKLREAYHEKKLCKMLELVEKLKYYCDTKPKRLLPNKEDYLNEIYEKVRQGYFELNRLNPNQYAWDQEKRIYLAFGIPIDREPSQDSIIGQFKNVFEDNKKQILIFEDRLRSAEKDEEISWCYHELCRYHIETNCMELARVYGKKCIQEGKRNNQPEWAINGLMLLVKINALQHNKNDAKNDINDAIKIAQEMKNGPLVEYLERCLLVLGKIYFDDVFGPKVIEKREQKLLKMMGTLQMKNELAHMFHTMSAMPSTRRMSVMPGIRPEDIGGAKKGSRKLSIMPQSKDTTRFSSMEARKSTPKKAESKGLGFMDAIEYHG